MFVLFWIYINTDVSQRSFLTVVVIWSNLGLLSKMIVITGGSVNLDLNYSWASIDQLEVAHKYIGSRNTFWGINLILTRTKL